MAGVKDPAKGFGQVVGGVEDTRDVLHDNVASFFPFLDCKELYVDVARSFSGDAVVDDFDGRHVVFEGRAHVLLRSTALVPELFGGDDGRIERRMVVALDRCITTG